jgi:hypothetical protein
MQSTEKRLVALEQAQPQTERVFFIFLVGLGEQDMELTYIYDSHENHWHRLPNETEREFRDRATSETPRKENQTVLLFGSATNTRA